MCVDSFRKGLKNTLLVSTLSYLPTGDPPLYGVYRYVRPKRVSFMSGFGVKNGIST